ncbi:hypothetical protein DPMN_096249 [Dreissena polymorpha]|uniref:Uncharacterized protein n=1 Tax=Dreissena polymorpha TaxID=45954 RepID=A0A9D4L7Z0_DREPO|nr:hypothetical protein DPMN_096249 [Dreissena polymorpha]
MSKAGTTALTGGRREEISRSTCLSPCCLTKRMKYLCSANSSRKRNCSGIRVGKHVPHKGVCARLGTGAGN